MRKIILTSLTLLSLGFANAQSRDKGTIELIPQIGYSTSNYYGEDEIDSDPHTDFTFGVGADYFFNNRWSLRSGLHYQIMGAEGNGGYEETLKYLTIPVNANWHFGSTRKWNLNFGPSVSFLTGAENNFGDIKDNIKSTQIAFNIGIGYKIEVSENFSILIDYQGLSGLTEVYEDSDFNPKNGFSSFNVGAVLKL